MITIPEIELNFCNACSGRCFICANAHGYGNAPLMIYDVFDAVCRQLADIQFRVIQTSGNGDCWLHPGCLQFLRTLRNRFPTAQIHNYSSFALYAGRLSRAVIGGNLINKQHTRLDSLDAETFGRATGLNLEIVLARIDLFLEFNSTSTITPIPLVIGYSSIPEYYRKCRTLLDKPPFHGPFSEEEAASLPDEFDAIRQRFAGGEYCRVERINQSLWAERADPRTPPDKLGACPKLPIFETTAWICPDGRVNVCGYDDTQDRFTVGNILEDHLADIWTGPKRRELIDRIQRREISDYPCNPKCCTLYKQ